MTQCAAPAFVAITVSSAAEYVRIMRRWMIFASHYFRENFTVATAFWIGLPGILPLLGLVTAGATKNGLFWLALLLLKALLNRILLWRVTGFRSSALDLAFECLADLTMPVWMLLAYIQPRRLTWRSRRIELAGREIRYR